MCPNCLANHSGQSWQQLLTYLNFLWQIPDFEQKKQKGTEIRASKGSVLTCKHVHQHTHARTHTRSPILTTDWTFLSQKKKKKSHWLAEKKKIKPIERNRDYTKPGLHQQTVDAPCILFVRQIQRETLHYLCAHCRASMAVSSPDCLGQFQMSCSLNQSLHCPEVDIFPVIVGVLHLDEREDLGSQSGLFSLQKDPAKLRSGCL